MAIAAEIDVLTFWELEPFEFGMMIDEYYRRRSEKQEEHVTLAYMTAAWTAQWFSKRQPKPLQQILTKIKKPTNEKKHMTDDEMFKTIQILNKALGGD